ncbi:hypothetical protein IMZ31_24305 (plasmid) [Pontibacillus sp. ALD_SL1]|uniref:hypothetical protein n=1 Tax=Pontibacillus sp. ALD_SL1 TaxID=2777185 RepID=UPI001A97AAE4|nr:hypothetical protein [Pontibacillus sp. ALD_SL1]QST02576.1 hypothetical protein IMZ31_24305 [Pontibacillus sp. ALD_SL1]
MNYKEKMMTLMRKHGLDHEAFWMFAISRAANDLLEDSEELEMVNENGGDIAEEDLEAFIRDLDEL